MLAADRIARILKMVKENGSVKVENLSAILGVSEMTVRRDLEKCEKTGVIERCYGGAVLRPSIEGEEDYLDKSRSHQSEKSRLASAAVKLVSPGDTVYLDAGTTTYEIAKLLRGYKHLTVITNDLEIALLLTKSNLELIMLGGIVQKSTNSISDEIAEQNMRIFRADIAFIGGRSIDTSFNVFTPTIQKAYLKRTVTKNSNKKYLVVDASKFYKQALVKIDNMSDYTGVITDKAFTAEEMKAFREKNIHIIKVQ